MYRFGRLDPVEFALNPIEAVGKQQRRLNAAIGRNTIAASAATFGTILNPEIFDVSTDISRATFGAFAVYSGIKAIINSHRLSTFTEIAIESLIPKVDEPEASQSRQ